MRRRASAWCRSTIPRSARRSSPWATASTSCCAGVRRRRWRREVKVIPTPSQTVGPFFAVGLDRAETADLTHGGAAKGERIEVEGRVLDGDGAPVPDAMLEIWQANAEGKYRHPDDRQAKRDDP